MVKLRFANLNAELDGDPREIVSILRDLGVSNQNPHTIITPAKISKPMLSNGSSTISNDELFQKLPDKEAIIEMIEGLGKPFSFTLLEQQKKIFGRIISSRENRPPYSKFYDLHKKARDAIKEKYGGHWIKSNDAIDGHPTTRYTWSEGDEIAPDSQPTIQKEGAMEGK